ncbi:MAG: PolC-type DNA polymerase III [Myxococcota bacterium]
MRWKHLPIVAFDTETTGLQPFAGDRIIEFAAVVLRLDEDGQVMDVQEHSWLVNPQIPIPRKVTEITGITDADVAGKPKFADIADEVFDLLSESIAVAHNFPFDRAFLAKEFRDVLRHWPEPLAEIDTVDVSMIAFPGARSHRLGDVCKRLDISLVDAHRATNDAEACGRVFTELARKHNVEDDLQAMLSWARAIGRPPPGGPIGPDDDGRLVFQEGPHEGISVADHPLYLGWMQKAKTRGPQGWTFTYPESTREWIARWLAVRGAGRQSPSAKSPRPDDWMIDPCIADDRRPRS